MPKHIESFFLILGIWQRRVNVLSSFYILSSHSQVSVFYFVSKWYGQYTNMVSATILSLKVKVLVAQLCLTLCDPMDCSCPGSSVHVILQARILEWGAVPSSLVLYVQIIFLNSTRERTRSVERAEQSEL